MKLKPPVSYQGGKQKVGDKIANILIKPNSQYIDLCCGSGAVSLALFNNGVDTSDITMLDASDWGDFWMQVSTRSLDIDLLEDLISKVPLDRNLIKPYLDDMSSITFTEMDDVVPYWLILQAGSFGGKHIYSKGGRFHNCSFRSYWQPTETSSRRSPVNPMMPMPDSLLLNVKTVTEYMQGVNAIKGFVEDFNWEAYEDSFRKRERVVVFIDPPYDSTTGYGFSLDYKAWLQQLKLPDCYEVWITDYTPHSDEHYILSSTKKGGISGGSKSRTEILSRVK